MGDFPSKKRWLSGLCLVIALLMLILGQTVFVHSLQGRTFILYWLACFALTGLAAIVALVDFFSLQRQARMKQREIIEEVFSEPAKKDEPHSRS